MSGLGFDATYVCPRVCRPFASVALHAVTRVAHLISGLMYGGGQKVALDLLDGLQSSQDIEAKLCIMGCRNETLRKRADFIADYDGDYSSLSTLRTTARHVRAYLASSNIDVVHSHGWDADMVGYLATLGRPVARVVHLHVTPNWIFSGKLQHRGRRMMTRLMLSGKRTRTVAVADAVRAHWTRAFGGLTQHAQVVHNAADPLRFSPAREPRERDGAPIVIGTACRLTAQKGLPVLLRAIRDIARQPGRQVAVKIAGDGPEREQLGRLAVNLNIHHLVEFLGHVDETETFYRALDVFVLPAVSDEGLPLAILEAMASGAPVISTDVGGSAEAVRNGIDGFVVAPNSPVALANALVTLIENPALRLAMASAATDRARISFSPSRQLSSIMSIYSELVTPRGTERGTSRAVIT